MARVAHLNTTDITEAIRLGSRTMQSVFDADGDCVPFFGSTLRPQAALSFSAHHSESHVPGRHLNALLNPEDAAGVELDEEAVDYHRRAALLCYSGPTALPLKRQHPGGPPVNFCPHNLRKGFHALHALSRFRDDRQAAELFERSIAAVESLWSPEAGWDLERLRGLGLQYQECQGFLHDEARLLGPLVKSCRATGSPAALRLALAMAEKALAEFLLPDGEYHPDRFITRHVHSITCTLSSLAQLAELLGNAGMMRREKAFYDRCLWAMRDPLGWSPEATGQEDSDRGESNNTGDILETALILGRWGHPEYYHDAERILRWHLLPSQLRDVSFVVQPDDPEGVDGRRRVGDRHLGTFGFPAPYSHQSAGRGHGTLSFNMDIVGGTVGSLCEAYRRAARRDEAGTRVNLLFDHQTPFVRVRSSYPSGVLSVEALAPGPLCVRLPPWAEPGEVEGRSGPAAICASPGPRCAGPCASYCRSRPRSWCSLAASTAIPSACACGVTRWRLWTISGRI